MKKRAILSARGTITVPASIRKIANLHPGDIVEFETSENGIVIRQLIVKHPEEEAFMSDNEWEKFDKMVKKQLKRGEYTSYADLEKAKEHSRRLKE